MWSLKGQQPASLLICSSPLMANQLQAKAAIDAGQQQGQAPLSWADTIVLAAKVSLACSIEAAALTLAPRLC